MVRRPRVRKMVQLVLLLRHSWCRLGFFYFSLLLSCLQLVMAILTEWMMSFCLFQLPQNSSMLPWPFETNFCESLTNIMEENKAIVFCRWFVRKYFLSSRFYHAHISRRVKARFPPSEKLTFCCGSRLYRTFSTSSMAGILMFSGSHLWSIRTYSCHYFHSYFARTKFFFPKMSSVVCYWNPVFACLRVAD